MQTNNSKNRTTQLPNQVVAVKPLRINSSCLIRGRQDKPCVHQGCYLFFNKPKYYIKKEQFYADKVFSHFKLSKSVCSNTIFALPVNPYIGIDKCKQNDFEGFRQSQNAVMEAHGVWPAGRDTFLREEVRFEFISYLDEFSAYNFNTGRNEWNSRIDVKEVLVYAGSIEIEGVNNEK